MKNRWYQWKQNFVQAEAQAIPRHQPIFSLLPDYPTTRVPAFLLKHEIQAHNRLASAKELVQVIQNPSGLSSITASQADTLRAILDSFIPQVDPVYERPAEVVLSYLYHDSEVVPRISAEPISNKPCVVSQ